MKLNKYLYKKFTQEHEEFVIPSENWPFTEEDIDKLFDKIKDVSRSIRFEKIKKIQKTRVILNF